MNQIKAPFFTIPQQLVRAGTLHDMKCSEVSLVVALHHEMERLSNPVFVTKNADLTRLTGLSTSSLRIARTKLVERGVIATRKVLGGTYEYSILNPETGAPWVRVPPRRGRAGGPSSGDGAAPTYEPVLSSPPATKPAQGIRLDF
jgi:hypothetical protein